MHYYNLIFISTKLQDLLFRFFVIVRKYYILFKYNFRSLILEPLTLEDLGIMHRFVLPSNTPVMTNNQNKLDENLKKKTVFHNNIENCTLLL